MQPDVATLRDLNALVKEQVERAAAGLSHVGDVIDHAVAALCNWDPAFYAEMYKAFIASTQIKADAITDTTNQKGKPLENLARYLVVHGGFAVRVDDITVPGVWQVDGAGPIAVTVVTNYFNGDFVRDFGSQVYIECKNHSGAMDQTDFNEHHARMTRHGCNCGIALSALGFVMGNGLGMARNIHPDFRGRILHLLLAVCDLKEVADGAAPLTVLRASYHRAANDAYVQKPGWSRYTEEACRMLAKAEYDRLFPSAGVVADPSS